MNDVSEWSSITGGDPVQKHHGMTLFFISGVGGNLELKRID